MANGNESPRRAPTPTNTRGPGTQPCRAVPRVHTFGKGGQALRRDPHAPPAMRGWLHKQDSSGLRLWKRRWFVLVDLCLYYYHDSSEQRVRGGLPLPGYKIRVLPPAPRAPRFLFTAEHPGMRTYCLGAETPEELNAWVCALRQGAAPLPGPSHPLSPQAPQEPLLPTRPPGWCSRCPPSEELGPQPPHPPRHPPIPPLPPSKEEAPAREGPCRTEHSRERPRGEGRSPRKLRPSGAQTNQPPHRRGPDAAERDIAANQTSVSPTDSFDWLLAVESADGAPPSQGTSSPPAANEASPWQREGPSGRQGVARRPIRITLLQASF